MLKFSEVHLEIEIVEKKNWGPQDKPQWAPPPQQEHSPWETGVYAAALCDLGHSLPSLGLAALSAQ